MGLLDALIHAMNFIAPAAALALCLALGSRIFKSKTSPALSWRAHAAIVFGVGCAVLLAGLVLWGRDGKMLTYAALVLVCASCQWVLGKRWKA